MRASRRSLIVLTLCLAACASASPARPPRGDDAAWVEHTLARLTVREKVGQLVMPRISGAYAAEHGAELARYREWVTGQQIGGVIVSIGPPLEVAAKLNVLQALADVPLLVAADVEHGAGQVLRAGTILPYGIDNGGATRFPPLMGLGAAGDERLAWELGRITALEARAVGVHVAFAPVVDVNNNPANPIINVRSYGGDARRVAALTRAHVRGLEEHGMLATAKHFPGHGDTGRDSHIEPLVIAVDAARADSVELVPFRAAIAAGVGAVMTAHVAFPALTGDSVPATLNPRLLDGLLRRDLGFDGLIFTDALDMGAIVQEFARDAAPVLALQAGADVLLQVMPDDVPVVIDALVAAVADGRISEARLDASVRRVLRAKARLGLHQRRTVDLAGIDDVLATDAHLALAQEAAERSMTLVRDERALLPLHGARVLSIVYTDERDPWAGRTLQRELERRHGNVATAWLDARADSTAVAGVIAAADSADVVVFSPFVGVAAYKGTLALPAHLAAAVDALAARRPVVVVSFGDPYLLAQLPAVPAYLLAWGGSNASQRAAARALLGESPITGRLPIALPPDYPAGHGILREGRAAQ